MDREKSIAKIAQEVAALLEEAENRFDNDDNIYKITVCLDCRKIFREEIDSEPAIKLLDVSREEDYGDDWSCINDRHTMLELRRWEGPTDIIGALECLRWILKKAEGT